jgi:hypothetical protein
LNEKKSLYATDICWEKCIDVIIITNWLFLNDDLEHFNSWFTRTFNDIYLFLLWCLWIRFVAQKIKIHQFVRKFSLFFFDIIFRSNQSNCFYRNNHIVDEVIDIEIRRWNWFVCLLLILNIQLLINNILIYLSFVVNERKRNNFRH